MTPWIGAHFHRVEKDAPKNAGCLLWQGSTSDGYGVLWVPLRLAPAGLIAGLKKGERKMVRVHILLWEQAHHCRVHTDSKGVESELHHQCHVDDHCTMPPEACCTAGAPSLWTCSRGRRSSTMRLRRVLWALRRPEQA